jgi:hypothetical protein
MNAARKLPPAPAPEAPPSDLVPLTKVRFREAFVAGSTHTASHTVKLWLDPREGCIILQRVTPETSTFQRFPLANVAFYEREHEPLRS